MRKVKFCMAFGLMFILTMFAGLMAFTQPAHAATSTSDYQRTYIATNSIDGTEIKLDYTNTNDLKGEIDVVMTFEHDEATMERFEKYCKKKIDSADIGAVFYITTTAQETADKNSTGGTYKFSIKLPKSYKHKEMAVIPFLDYRSPQNLKPVSMNKDTCTITFTGNHTAYAYAIVYNGAYKDVIMIIIILLSVLIICIVVKVLCLRKDNPEVIAKKRQAAVEKKKQQHRQNKKLAKELKREREKLKRIKPQ